MDDLERDSESRGSRSRSGIWLEWALGDIVETSVPTKQNVNLVNVASVCSSSGNHDMHEMEIEFMVEGADRIWGSMPVGEY